MIELSISNAIAILGGIFSLVGVYVALNNRIIILSEKICALKEQQEHEEKRHLATAAITDKNYEKFYDALQKNTNAINKIEGFLENLLNK